jgi:hypothetical protein
MAIYLMDKSYRIATTGGTPSGRVVVAGSTAGQCAVPAAANAGKILGVAVTSQTELGRSLSVRKAGTAEVTAAGAIAVGDPVNIADDAGRVKTVNESSGIKVQCLGFAETPAATAGDMIEVFISIHERTP